MSDEQTLSKAYEPSEVESKWYKIWEERGYFHANPESGKVPYTIVIPPPNVTGILTLGHVLNNTLQDILLRFERLRGREVCWVPGTDHAGIATQAKVEAALKKEHNLTRHDMSRDEFVAKVWEWKEKYGGVIIKQLRTIGSSCDWERERFTMDPGLSQAVQEVFIRLYNKGLIYKGKRMVNWCPKLRSAISDEEVIYTEEKGKLWHFRYPYADGSGYVVVATTRPETMMGDTAVAVNPSDERYTDKVGKTVILPIMNREIPIIADEYVEKEFGTGAVKITPAHDPNDYEIGLRHNLEFINLMNEDATMNENAGPFVGMDRDKCRAAVVAKMEELGMMEKIEDYTHQVGYSERGKVPVEPRLSDQWFLKMETLAKPALQAVLDGRIQFHPDRWVKTYRHWMENIKDWCISRQLWWGHRIPAYYCDKCGEVVVARETPTKCPKCGHDHFTQDPDVLDTWFSSWLWPFSVFDWPKESIELKKFFPTQTLVTGPDIIFFWVARMIMSSLEFMGEIPFSDVYFTSIIRDEKGRKLSKSLNNSPDPLEVIKTYGADALRFTMIYITPLGQDIRYSNEKCEIGRNFANKIWNVVRFRLQKGKAKLGWPTLDGVSVADLRPDDQWIIFELNETVKGITQSLEAFRFDDVCKSIYDFIWNRFCDWYLESCKPALSADAAGPQAATTLRVFDYVLGTFLRLLHPIMPFVTDELAHQMGFVTEDDSIMKAQWPAPLAEGTLAALGATADQAEKTEAKHELIRAVRALRANYQIPPSRPLDLLIAPTTAEGAEFLQRDEASLRSLLYAANLTIQQGAQGEGACGVAVSSIATAYLPLKGLIDVEAEVKRLQKQEAELVKYLEGVNRKLSNQNFVARAPAEVVEAEKAKVTEGEAKLARIREQIATFQG